jgi:hypothetical protein
MRKGKVSAFERLTSGKLNRKQRKELGRKLYSENPGLEVDVGNAIHYVASALGFRLVPAA